MRSRRDPRLHLPLVGRAARIPNLGTVEVRVYDQQTRLEDSIALAALAICLVHRYHVNFDASRSR